VQLALQANRRLYRALRLPEQVILAYVAEHERINRREATQLTGMTEEQAKYRLGQMVIEGFLNLVARGCGAEYEGPETEKKRGIPHFLIIK